MTIAASMFVEMPVTPRRGGQIFDFSGIVRPRHHHDELEFNLGVRGLGVLAVGTRRIELHPGTLLWFLRGQDHVLEAATPDFQMWIAAFKPRLVEEYQRGGAACPLPTLSNQVRQLSRTTAAELGDICQTGFSGPYEADRDDLIARLLERALAAHEPLESERPRVHIAVQKSVRQLLLDPTLGRQELARRAGLGPEALSRRFAENVGVSLPEYKNRLRIGRFLRAIEQGETNLLGAALHAGFGSYSQFHRILKEQTGHSPTAFASLEVRREAMRLSIPLAVQLAATP